MQKGENIKISILRILKIRVCGKDYIVDKHLHELITFFNFRFLFFEVYLSGILNDQGWGW